MPPSAEERSIEASVAKFSRITPPSAEMLPPIRVMAASQQARLDSVAAQDDPRIRAFTASLQAGNPRMSELSRPLHHAQKWVDSAILTNGFPQLTALLEACRSDMDQPCTEETRTHIEDLLAAFDWMGKYFLRYEELPAAWGEVPGIGRRAYLLMSLLSQGAITLRNTSNQVQIEANEITQTHIEKTSVPTLREVVHKAAWRARERSLQRAVQLPESLHGIVEALSLDNAALSAEDFLTPRASLNTWRNSHWMNKLESMHDFMGYVAQCASPHPTPESWDNLATTLLQNSSAATSLREWPADWSDPGLSPDALGRFLFEGYTAARNESISLLAAARRDSTTPPPRENKRRKGSSAPISPVRRPRTSSMPPAAKTPAPSPPPLKTDTAQSKPKETAKPQSASLPKDEAPQQKAERGPQSVTQSLKAAFSRVFNSFLGLFGKPKQQPTGAGVELTDFRENGGQT